MRIIDVQIRELKGVTNKVSGFIKNLVLCLPYIAVMIASYVGIYMFLNKHIFFN